MQLAQWVELQDWTEKEQLKFALRNDITFLLFADIHYKIIKGLNTIFGCFGLPGSGKSRVLLWIFWRMEIMFKVNFASKNPKLPHIAGNRAEMRNILAEADPLCSYMLDENKKEKGTGSKRIEDEFVDIIDASLRGQTIFFGQACPDYDETIPHHLILKPRGIDWKKEETKSLVFVPNDKKKLIPIGFVITGNPPKYLVDNYLKKKDKNMQSIQKGDDPTRMKMWNKYAKQLISDARWYDADTNDEKKLAADQILPSGLTKDEKKSIIKIAEKLHDQDDEDT